ncbi:hypothetical protein AO442_000921, partial [Nakaseomyces glabratus]
MKYKEVFKAFILALTWTNAVAKTYENQEVVLDSTSSGSPTFEDDELMVLNNAKVTLKNYSSIKLPAGISLTGGSTLTIITPGGQSVRNELLINGKVKIDSGSSFVYDGSKLTYASGPDAVTNYNFDINTGADGVYVSSDSSMIITLPALLKGVATTNTARIHIGGTYQAPNNSPIQILGKLQVLSTGAKSSTYFTDRLWYLDLGPDKIDNTGTFSMPNNMSGDIDCECLIAVYGDIFKGTNNAVLHTLGYTGFVVVTPITIDLSKGPYKGTSDFIYNLVLPSGQDGFKIDGYLYHYDPNAPAARTIGLLYLYDAGDNVALTSGINGIQIRHTNPVKTITMKVDPSLNAGYFKGKRIDEIPYRYPVHNYANVLEMILFEPITYTTITTTNINEYTTEIIELIATAKPRGFPFNENTQTTITTTIYNQLREETKIIDLGNGVTEYQVLDYYLSSLNDINHPFGTSTKIVTYSPPPPSVTATTTDYYIESYWISFFITTDDQHRIITSSQTVSTLRLENDYTTTVDLGNGVFETDLISHITERDENGEPTNTVRTTIKLTFGPAPPAITKTVDLGNEVTEYLVISYWTTTNEFGGLITTNSTATYSPPPVTVTATTASDYIESDWISFFITVDEKGDIVTSSTLFNATRDYNLPEAPHTSFGPAPPVETHTVVLENNMTNYEVVSYWTTTNEFGGLITTSSTSTYSAPPLTVTATTASDYIESDWISFFITVDEKGDIVTSSTLFNATRDYNLPEAPHTSFGPAPPVETHTVVLENNMTNYEVVSYWTTTNEFGGLITTSSTSTYSAPPLTVTATTASDYIESDWISFFITVDEKGDIVTSSTLFNATRDYNLPEAPHTSFGPAPPVETHTVVLENNMTNYEVVSYWTTTNEFGGLITTSSTSTYSAPPLTVTATTASDYIESDWISFFITVDEKGDIVTSSTLFNATREYVDAEALFMLSDDSSQASNNEADYTTTIDKGNGEFETDVVSHITTKDSDGKPTTIVTTIPWKPSEEADYTTTIDKGNGEFETDVVSHITTKDSDGKPTTIVTTIPWKPSEEADYTTTIDKGNGEFETDVVSHITTKDSDGKPTTIVTTIPWKPSEEADYTTTIDKGNGEFETDVVSHITTKDSDGKPTTIVTTIPWKPSEEADYTTTIDKGNGEFETDVVSHITTKDSDGKPTTIVTTIPWKPSEEADYTTTIDKGNGEFETDVVSHITTKDSDGKPTTITTTIPLKPSDAGEADYTTTIDKGNGDFETDLVSHITTKDSDGKPTTITTTIPLKPSDAGEADYTTTITSDGHTITEVVSHITTTDSDGNTVTYTTTMASFDQVGDGVYTSAPPYSQPPVVTTTVTEDDGSSKTVVISYSPSEGEDGVTRTGTTTISTITASGEADYTTTIDKGNGDFETDLVSHITTKDSDGKPTTITTTIPLKPSDAGEADYTTTIDKGNGDFETDLVSHITTKDSDGKPTTIITTVTLTEEPD